MKNSIIKLFAVIGILSVVVFATLAFSSTAQDEQELYCELVGSAKFMSKKVVVSVDFGNNGKMFADQRIKDELTGKAKSFNSMVDALNYMGSQGWEFAQAYTVTTGNSNVYHWLLKKKQ